MSKYKMNQYVLQSYFKSVCNSFYIAYDQVKRLEKEKEKLATTNPNEELAIIESCLEMYKTDAPQEIQQKYAIQVYSEEKLRERKEKLQQELEEYMKSWNELEEICDYWTKKMWDNVDKICTIMAEIKRNKFSIIVTTKEEVYALMCFYYDHLVKDYPVVNMKEEHIQAFPTGEEMYDDFLFAYKEALDDYGLQNAMELLYDKYF